MNSIFLLLFQVADIVQVGFMKKYIELGTQVLNTKSLATWSGNSAGLVSTKHPTMCIPAHWLC